MLSLLSWIIIWKWALISCALNWIINHWRMYWGHWLVIFIRITAIKCRIARTILNKSIIFMMFLNANTNMFHVYLFMYWAVAFFRRGEKASDQAKTISCGTRSKLNAKHATFICYLNVKCQQIKKHISYFSMSALYAGTSPTDGFMDTKQPNYIRDCVERHFLLWK